MPSKSKIKGSSFEREYAKFLSELYNDSFHRVPGSGAYVGGRNVVRKDTLNENQAKSFKGDINAPDDWIRFNSELKSYADFPFHQLMTGSVKILDQWIDQCMQVAGDSDFSFVAFKITRKGTFIAVKNSHEGLTFDNYLRYNHPKFGEWIVTDSERFWKQNTSIIEKICKS